MSGDKEKNFFEDEMPKELKNVIDKLWDLKNKGISINRSIEESLEFKNPYLLEKIMNVFDIKLPYPTKIEDEKKNE